MKNTRKAKICLSMIVRDEEHVTDRFLKNCDASVDAVTIVDTGSVDNTKAKIEAYMKQSNKLGGVKSLPWRDFDRSRNDALEYSFQTMRTYFGLPLDGPITAKEYDKSLEEDWYWFMHDADDGILSDECKEEINEKNLSALLEKYPVNLKTCLAKSKPAEFYSFAISTGKCSFYYTRLFKMYASGAKAFRWHNPIHEVAYNELNLPSEVLKGVQVFSGKTGGRSKRGNKYLLDLSTFTTSMTNGRIPPSSIARTLFYMGQSAMDTQFFDQAIYYYTERTKRKEGTYFERYVSHLRIAAILPFCRSMLHKEITEEGMQFERMKHLWAAHTLSPHRREACYELGKYHHDRKEFKIAWDYLSAGLQYDRPTVNDSFADESLYGWKYYDMVYLTAYYVPLNDEFIKYAKMVALDACAPKHVSDKARENLSKFAKIEV